MLDNVKDLCDKSAKCIKSNNGKETNPNSASDGIWPMPQCIEPSYAALNCRNYIREIVDNLDLQPNPEKFVIALSIGDPTVYGNLNAPKAALTAIHQAVDAGKFNGYAPCVGYTEARRAVAEYLSYDPNVRYTAEDVILCSGCSSAIELCITALADSARSDNILVPRPGFPLYRTLAETLRIQVRYYNLLPADQWRIDFDHLEAQIDAHTAAIVLNNPSNPCGAVYDECHLRELLAIARRHSVPLICDEVYERLVFDTFKSAAAIDSGSVPMLICGGLAKRFLVPGWRLGWVVVRDTCAQLAHVRKGLLALCQRTIGANTLVQAALPALLSGTPSDFHTHLIDVLQCNATLTMADLRQVPGLRPYMPQGAMYMMVEIDLEGFAMFANGLEFVQKLMEEQSVFCLPGESFGLAGFMRIVLTVPEDLLREACIRIGEFCRKYYYRN